MGFFTRFSLRNPTVVVVAVILSLVGGIYTANNLPRETMPDVSIPIVAVIVPYPGAAPADVYDKITQPLESALGEVPGRAARAAGARCTLPDPCARNTCGFFEPGYFTL